VRSIRQPRFGCDGHSIYRSSPRATGGDLTTVGHRASWTALSEVAIRSSARGRHKSWRLADCFIDRGHITERPVPSFCTTAPSPATGDLTWTGAAPRESATARLCPRVLRTLLAAAALSNNRAAALLRFAAALAGSRGALCAGLRSAHAAGMVPRFSEGEDPWQLSAL
jgi:hypothetical protein